MCGCWPASSCALCPVRTRCGLLGALLERESDVNVCAAAVDVLAEIGDATILPALARCAERFSGEPFLVFAVKVASTASDRPPNDQRG